MLGQRLLQTSVLLWLAQCTLQGGVRPQTGSLGRLVPSRGAALGAAGLGGKPGGTGILGGRGYGGKPGKAGTGRYLGAGGYRPLSGRGGAKQGYGGALGGFGASLGTGLGLGLGNGLGVALGSQAGKLGGRGYTNGYGVQPGYGAGGYPSAGRGNGHGGGLPIAQGEKGNGYASTPGVPNGQGVPSNGYVPAPVVPNGQGGYGSGAGIVNGNGKGAKANGYSPVAGVSNGAGVISNGYGPGPIGVNGQGGKGGAVLRRKADKLSKTGYGLGTGSYPGAGIANGYEAALGWGGLPVGRVGKQTGGTGGVLEPVTGGGVGQIPYNGAPVIPAGLEAENGYGYGPQQLNLGTDGGKLAYEDGGAYGAQPAGYGAALGAGGQAPYGGAKDGSKYGLGGFYGNRIKG
ncbi:glycine-rich cell wall structural protein 1.0 [Pygocentrus nattereri]|uniref:glycine-rich cell wall structural protein 1.0 n=1 Tax=Pygocentrus nattereri TaxID=42514 RepID=UPI001891B2F9|nr:glycine-rich cell wall structural protein 1.0 [Pygocentrus nattereri]